LFAAWPCAPSRGADSAAGERPSAPLSVPGNITVRVRTEGRTPPSKYRRFFATESRKAGQFGVQETASPDGSSKLQVFFHAPGLGVVRNVLLDEVPEPGRETVLSMNVSAGGIEFWKDGFRVGSIDTGGKILSAIDFGKWKGGGGAPGVEILSFKASPHELSRDEIVAEAVGRAPAAGSLAWFPSRSAIACELAVPADAADLRLEVDDASGRRVFTAPLPRPGTFATTPGGKFRLVHDVVRIAGDGRDGGLRPGKYAARVARGAGASRRTALEKTFEAADFPWFGAREGREEILLPGFEPVRASGGAVETAGRKYVFGANGLPREMWSLGRQILARPIRLVGRHEAAAGRCRVESRGPVKAVFAGTGARGRVEQDGFVLTEISVPAGDGEAVLEIPVKAEFATLFHACGEGIRHNPAGFVPPGFGKVFGSREIPDQSSGDFIPYCWVGTDDRGVCFMADSDRGWRHGPVRDAVELHRENDGTVVMRLRLAEGVGPHPASKVVLGLMATPAKPRPEGWRGWSNLSEAPGTLSPRLLASSPYWGCYACGMARYPAFRDLEYVRRLADAVRTGKTDRKWTENWIARCLEALDKAPELVRWLARKPRDEAEKTLRAHVGASFRIAESLHGLPQPALIHYTCDRDPGDGLYEMPVMADEWGAFPSARGSYIDFAAWWLAQNCRAGMGGVYHDNAFPRPDRDWVAGSAWIDTDGDVRPGFGLFALREHARRQMTAMLEAGVRSPWLVVHHTNANIVPILSFATCTMGMEWKYGAADFQDRWTPDYVRTVNQGLQAGVVPASLEGIQGCPDSASRKRVARTMLATLLPHEIRPAIPHADNAALARVLRAMFAFGVQERDCGFRAYWDPLCPVEQTDGALVSAYTRGRRVLAVCGGFAGSDMELKLRLRTPGAEIVSARNAETGEPVPVSGGGAVLRLPRHDFALVELETSAE
ncbi:MAG: hypothetical protein IJ783_11145, partial [Kiritimatiellae bacterium]|nr:hypothetical protein [Kiritimatiellia bacterium]